jgi:selenocysteine lyase/cysteine desulfurase
VGTIRPARQHRVRVVEQVEDLRPDLHWSSSITRTLLVKTAFQALTPGPRSVLRQACRCCRRTEAAARSSRRASGRRWADPADRCREAVAVRVDAREDAERLALCAVVAGDLPAAEDRPSTPC